MPEVVRLRPMTEEEYAAWRERSEREYAKEIATSRDLDEASAVAQSAAVGDRDWGAACWTPSTTPHASSGRRR